MIKLGEKKNTNTQQQLIDQIHDNKSSEKVLTHNIELDVSNFNPFVFMQQCKDNVIVQRSLSKISSPNITEMKT